MAINLTGNNSQDANTIKSQFQGYAGWNDPNAIVADYKATQGAGKGGSTSPSGSNNSSSSNNYSSSNNSLPTSIDPQQAVDSALKQASAVRQFNIDSAQPQIQTLQKNSTDLDTRYKTLLDSIKGDQTQAVNNATKAENATLVARGLSTHDPGAMEDQSSAQSAAAQPYSSLEAQTGISQSKDLNDIASQIAALQSGNPSGAISSSNNIQTLAQQLAALGLQQNQQSFSQRYIPIPNLGIYDVENKQLLSGTNPTGLGSNGVTITGVT